MSSASTSALATARSVREGIVESRHENLIVFSPAGRAPRRRVLYTNSYGGRVIWDRVTSGHLPAHHLWGCLELVRMGYEVALAEPLTDFYYHRNPLPHDLRLLKVVRSWLGKDGIVYCGHNVLHWLPLLRGLGLLRCRIVSLLFGREPLDLARSHSGIIALNGAAAEHAKLLAPKVPVAQLAWGVDREVFPHIPYQPQTLLACGQTMRDQPTLARATLLTQQPIRVIAAKLPPGLTWGPNVSFVGGGQADDNVTYDELFRDHYARCTASLIILRNDPKQATGVGFTNLLESMAMARPVIVTRTGALPTEIDVEQAGIGLFVPPEDPAVLARAIDTLAADPAQAEAMGAAGRELVDRHYNMGRYARELSAFFDRL
jgi:glycosyltransferase involved in cell wall biosynthesis